MIRLERPLIFFDLETTGIDVNKDRIVEISMLKLYPKNINTDYSIEKLYYRLNPEIPIPESATAVHGISYADIANKPTLEQLATEIINFIDGCDMAGFNSNAFDVPLLYNELIRVGAKWDVNNIHFIDVSNMFKIHEPRTLEAGCRFYLNKELSDAHSANADTKATLEVFNAMLKRYDDIPDNVAELAVHSNYDKRRLGISGHFAYNDEDEIVFNFGKYKGEKASEHLDYLHWMSNQDFPPDTRGVINKFL